MDYTDISTLPLPWDYGQLFMVSACEWEQEKMPASALKFSRHFKRTELSSQDTSVFKDFIMALSNEFSDDQKPLQEALVIMQLDVNQSKECLLSKGTFNWGQL